MKFEFPSNKQDAFNRVWQYFIVEKNPPGIQKSHCSYRTVNGDACGVGVLLPNESLPRFHKEGKVLNWGIERLLECSKHRQGTYELDGLDGIARLSEIVGEALLNDLQDCHDVAAAKLIGSICIDGEDIRRYPDNPDYSEFTRVLRDGLAEIARYHGLNVPENSNAD
jgi:hypothetical protein